jgi:hypothetical protein
MEAAQRNGVVDLEQTNQALAAAAAWLAKKPTLPNAPATGTHEGTKPELPTAYQLVSLAALIGDKDALFKEFDEYVAEYDDPKENGSQLDKAMRRAMHAYVCATKVLAHAASLDAMDFARWCHDWDTALKLNEPNAARWEAEAWRFYPQQSHDDLRQHLEDNKVKGSFKDHGLPNALKRWWLSRHGVTKAEANRWWKDRLREGGYHAVYRWEITHFIGWSVESQRKKNRETVAASRAKKKKKSEKVA